MGLSIDEATYRFEEILREFNRIQCGRGDDEFEVIALLNGLLEEAEEHIRVDCALVGLVQHEDRVLAQVGVDKALSQKHTFCHVLDLRLGGCAVLETNGVAHLLTQTTPELLRHL